MHSNHYANSCGYAGKEESTSALVLLFSCNKYVKVYNKDINAFSFMVCDLAFPPIRMIVFLILEKKNQSRHWFFFFLAIKKQKYYNRVTT